VRDNEGSVEGGGGKGRERENYWRFLVLLKQKELLRERELLAISGVHNA